MKVRGFTLIEMLMVVAILTVLFGMAMPIIGVARTKSAQTNTMSLLKKVDAALEKFRGHTGTYPYKPFTASDSLTGEGNDLRYRLATDFHDLSVADQEAVLDDMEEARLAYTQGHGAHAIDEVEYNGHGAQGGAGEADKNTAYAEYVNRMAAERAVMGVLAGNSAIKGIKGRVTDWTMVDVVTTQDGRGYTFDFLSDDLSQSDYRGDDLVDAWSQPVIYNCPVVQGVVAFYPAQMQLRSTLGSFNEFSQGGIDPKRYDMHSFGREPTTLLDSDQRTTAARPYIFEYELWSAGSDYLIHETRSHPHNRDNLSARDYLEGLE